MSRKPIKWIDEPDLGLFALSRNLPLARFDCDPAGLSDEEKKTAGIPPIKPSLEETQAVFFGGVAVFK
jgi:hypothetical protein